MSIDHQALIDIVEQRMDQSGVLGRIACELRSNENFVQKHHDGREFDILWRYNGSFWRCNIFISKNSDRVLAQIDLHDDKTWRAEFWEPCSITVDPNEGLLCLTRYEIPTVELSFK